MKPLFTTMLMAALAACSALAAVYFYPRIEKYEDPTENKQLLSEAESFLPRDVRKVQIEQFDRSRNQPLKFELVFRDGSWVIPAKNGYPANNTSSIATLLSTFRDKEILETVSDQKEDHEKYDVLGLDEIGPTGLGAGTVLTFEGRNRKLLGKMIVGKSPKGKDGQRYVRLANQPTIYIVELNSTPLTTEFSNWVAGDLVPFSRELDPQGLVNLIDYVKLNLYYKDSAKGAKRRIAYQLTFRQSANGLWDYELRYPGEDQNLQDSIAKSSDVQGSGPQGLALSRIIQSIFKVDLKDVFKKQQSAALAFADPKTSQSPSIFQAIEFAGFFYDQFRLGQHQFSSAAGEIEIGYRFGLVTKVNIGNLNLDVSGSSGAGDINRYVLLSSYVDPSMIPEPAKPADPKDGEAEQDLQREYAALVQKRNADLKRTEQLAKSFNQLHADWIYLLPDEAVQRMLPPKEFWSNLLK